MTSRDDFRHTVGAASAGLLSDGAVDTIVRAAGRYRASALADLAAVLEQMARDVDRSRRGPLNRLRAEVAAATFLAAAKAAREAASQAQIAAAPVPAYHGAPGWAEPRTDDHSPAHARTTP